nr:Cu/Zn superoxide dismutase-like 1 [Halisarca dujardinii]
MKLYILTACLVAVFSTAVLGQGGPVSDVNTPGEDDERIAGEIPEDQRCGYKELLRETEDSLEGYGPNVCRKKAVYLESRPECNQRRVCRRQRNSFECRYVCRDTQRCVAHETIYTFEPVCCSGFASSLSSFLGNQSADVDQVLRDEGCPVVASLVTRATCLIRTGSVQGDITITQESPSAPAIISGTVTGLEAGKHGFHVHEFGDFQGGCGAAGGHYNPFGTVHGAPNDVVRHVGDLGNIEAGSDGMATVAITDHMVRLNGPISVAGRSFVVHAGVDDLGLGGVPASVTTGNAGGRVGCCVIGVARP